MVEIALTSSESEELVLSFEGPVFFRLILSVCTHLDGTRKGEEREKRKKTTLNYATENQQKSN